MELFATYKLRSRDFFSDLGMGLKLFMQGKLGLRLHRIKGQAALLGIHVEARAARRTPERDGEGKPT